MTYILLKLLNLNWGGEGLCPNDEINFKLYNPYSNHIAFIYCKDTQQDQKVGINMNSG